MTGDLGLPVVVGIQFGLDLDGKFCQNLCIDAMREYEKQGVIGKLHPYFYSTVGTGTTEAEAQRMAQEMIPYLKEAGVDAIIMGSM